MSSNNPQKPSKQPKPILEDWAAQVIRELAERGEWDNLPGKGKPLNLDGDLATTIGVGTSMEQMQQDTLSQPHWVYPSQVERLQVVCVLLGPHFGWQIA